MQLQADESKAIAMFKLPGGAVVAHTGQQPDRREDIPFKNSDKKIKDKNALVVPKIEKGKQI